MFSGKAAQAFGAGASVTLFRRPRPEAGTPDEDIVLIAKDGSVGTTDISGLPGLWERRLFRRRHRIVFTLAWIFCGTVALLSLAHTISAYASISARMDLAEIIFSLLSFGFGAIPNTVFAEQARTNRSVFVRLFVLSWAVYLLAARLAFYLLLPQATAPMTIGVTVFVIQVSGHGFRYLFQGGQW